VFQGWGCERKSKSDAGFCCGRLSLNNWSPNLSLVEFHQRQHCFQQFFRLTVRTFSAFSRLRPVRASFSRTRRQWWDFTI
jgi:hypothetical protein